MAETTNYTKPFIVDKNLGSALDIDNAQLTGNNLRWHPGHRTNAGTRSISLICAAGS